MIPMEKGELEETPTVMSPTEWVAFFKLAMMWKMSLLEGWALSTIKLPNKIHSSDEWITVLRLSTQLKLPPLRNIAIEALVNSLSAIRKFELAIECSVEIWLAEVYSEIVTRDTGLSNEEEQKLGWERASKLFRLRNWRFEKQTRGTAAAVINFELKSAIRTAFLHDFAAVTASNSSRRGSRLQSDRRTMPVADSEKWQRDRTYYDADIIFLVEDTLFKVPRRLFENNSIVFQDMLQLPTAEGVVPDGTTEDEPLCLEGIQKTPFQQLLAVMKCPTSKPHLANHVSETKGPKCWNEWAPVLELACMWEMSKLQGIAVKKILSTHQANKEEVCRMLKLGTNLEIPELRTQSISRLRKCLSAIEMVEFGIEYRVHDWLLEGYLLLAKKHGGITVQDENRLGRTTASRLFRVREIMFRKGVAPAHTRSSPNTLMKAEIKKLFAEELRAARWNGK